MTYIALFVAIAVFAVLAVWTLTFSVDLGSCGSAPICGPLRERLIVI